jgi:hemoglobin
MYDWLGGETTVRQLVNRFYDLMDSDADVATLRHMHQDDLSPMRQSLFEYLSGWLGGPPLFVQKRGSPCITKAHRPFQIDETAARQWMKCMRQAMVDVGIDAKYRQMLEPAFERVAQALRND